MAGMTRTRMALILPTIGLSGVLALAGCGVASPSTTASLGADVADEAAALQQVGFDTGLADTPSASPSASTGLGTPELRRRAIRKYLRKNTLHGEVAVQTSNGVKTIVVQRGAVTAVGAGSVTVRSTDGFSLTWNFADKLIVVQTKKKVTASALKTGEQVGVAGVKDGSATDARLIAIK
jgi:hypothetical protein